MKFHSLHSPMFYDEDEWARGPMEPINIAETDRKRRIAAMDEIKRALEVAEKAPFKFLVQHIGNGNESWDPHKFEAAMTSVEHLRAFAKPLGVTLLLENIPNELSTPEKLNELVNTAHFDDVGFCFDTGHALMMSNIAQAFDAMKHNIRSTHVHDNKGDKDTHLWPGEGNTDWAECAALLRTAPHRPPALLEIEGEQPANVPEKIREAFQVLEGEKAVSAK
jgi:sugar phosphate isomerase/epimerase